MWCNILKINRFYKTIIDIGFKRLYQRIRYECSYFVDSRISDYWKIINKESLYKPLWKSTLLELNTSDIILFKNLNKNFPTKEIEFTFLNITNKLIYPFQWNNKSWPRLWQFNLNYFDWSRNWIDKSLRNNEVEKNIYNLSHLIDQWIKSNKIGFGDGWHSYTTSLRIRNWTWILRAFPNLKTQSRLKSLWTQLCWLYKHPEICHGGNHWLENLTAQIIVSLQFDNNYAEVIYKNSIKKLKKELQSQILLDGGHEERSAAYHILILDRLVEVGWVIQIVKNERPIWIIKAIKKMTEWLCFIRIKKGELPLFNDSSKDICPDIDEVKEFAISYLNNTENKLFGIRRLLSKAKKDSFSVDQNSKFLDIKVPKIVDLKYTGWTFIRPQEEWELVFKSGPSCPKHLPAHTHSDLLSFDLFWNGNPIISEVGTSIYGECPKRYFERSGAAHNVLRLAKRNTLFDNILTWTEPVDVWGNFRAGRKAKTLMKSVKQINKNTFSISCSHNGFKSINAKHTREIKLIVYKDESIELLINDEINCRNNLIGNHLLHFGPDQKKENLKILTKFSKLIKNIKHTWEDTYYSLSFGRTLERKSLITSFDLPKGTHILQSKIIIQSSLFER